MRTAEGGADEDSSSPPPPPMADYGNTAYWNERYAAQALAADKDDNQQQQKRNAYPTFDWYQDYSKLKPHLQPFLVKDGDNNNHKKDSFSILIVGCGNSGLGASLYADGYRRITNIDTSPVVIKHMADQHSHLTGMKFMVWDARDTSSVFPDNSFDLIIDKALFDSLLCSESNITSVSLLVHEAHRLLRPGSGTYLMLSYGIPATRTGYLRSKLLTWTVSEKKIDKPRVRDGYQDRGTGNYHYLYICRKEERRPPQPDL